MISGGEGLNREGAYSKFRLRGEGLIREGGLTELGQNRGRTVLIISCEFLKGPTAIFMRTTFSLVSILK